MVKKNQKQHLEDMLHEPLAIIGMNCQFPGIDSDVEDVSAFYEMLLKGLTPIKEVPKNRWDIDEYYDPDRKKADKIVSRKGGFLENTHLFDAFFFKIPSLVAKQIDPQHRLFLEVSIRALNHANITLNSLHNSNTGVYCGISTHEYSQLNYKDNIKFNTYTQVGVASGAGVGRLSHFLNLKGPSIAVDSACSSSLSALYLAATALRTEQCDMAIVGGVHLSLCPETFIGLSKANLLSANGQCSSFDHDADGFARSEGCGVVIVKRLSDAIKDKNTIHAVIKSIVMNQDGDGASLSAPNLKAQIAMHEAALEQANLKPADIDYIEAHGTGTPVGDSVEFNAIQQVHKGHHRDQPLIIGALKSNLGHSITASGIASLIKAVSALKNETIPANLHYSMPNTLIDPQSIPAVLPIKTINFKKHKNKKRHAQVTNYSISGTNVALILEESPSGEINQSSEDNNQAKCIVVSANSAYSLTKMLADFIPYLQQTSEHLSDICYTLINCRDHYKFRCAIIAKDIEELIGKIEKEDFETVKVDVNNEIQNQDDAQSIYEHYRAGGSLRLENHHHKVDLPLYHFDRKSYWHDVRIKPNAASWLDSLYQQSKEQQIETIKSKLALPIQTVLNKKTIDEYQDFESLGLTKPMMETLDLNFNNLFSSRYTIKASPLLTLDKLARHVQQIIMPELVQRQPTINVLNPESIAIIGMSCRFPKAANIDEFLSLLERGESGMSDIPLERWDNEQFYSADADAPGCLYIKQLGLIDNVKKFDAEFFNISPREAKLMSPQLRVFMETSYHALEDANLSLEAVKDSNTGVFVGVGTNEYPRVLAYQGVSLDDLNIYFATGNVLNALAGRVAYSFDFHGPIQAIDTACSSAMTAIHNACLSLQSGDCTMALAGGINILLTPESNITLSKAKMLSPTSRCKTFSDDADGYARSEGCGIVVLKRLSQAIENGDTILAVIKGSSINSDGKSGGFTVPNGTAQEEVIRSALAKAQLSPGDIDYIEVHGTATPVADPIEVNTLTKIFSESHSTENPLYISSVKTNIGHCESASGVAGMIKAVLSLKSHTLFKHLNFKNLNPGIELKNTIIPLSKLDWQKDNLRCAGVSSFGFSGANAHIILQEAPRNKIKKTAPLQESVLVLSAKKRESLELLLKRYQDYLADTDLDFADICYTAATCRSHFLFRVAIKANTTKEAADHIAKKEYTIYQVKKEKELYSSNQLDELQSAYQNGFTINWSDYYKSQKNQFEKVKLPLYEFTREEHWFELIDKLKDAPLPKDWSFQLQWQNQSYDKSIRKTHGSNWLLIGGKNLASNFRSQGLKIIFEEDNQPLETIDGVIFAAGLDLESPADIDATIEFQKNTLKKLLNLIKGLQQKDLNPQLLILTTQAITELANERLNLSNSPLIGFCKTLVLELPQFNTILIDSDNIKEDGYCAQIVNEINYNHGQNYEHIIAYRESKRLVQRLKKTTLIDRKRALYGEGRYLITGGCGGLGLITAQALLSAGARELILTSRHVDKPLIKAAIQKIKLIYPGRTIRTVSLDITDKEKLAHLLSELNEDGLLKGIIHAAGAAIKADIIDHQDSDVDYLFSAKVQGGWYLHELTQKFDLDFFIVYSSISSVFGSNKESVYSATNSFLDALIAERQRLGLVGSAIQWGPWGEVGMAKKRSRDQNMKKALVSNEQGQVLIKVLINNQFSHATIISPQYLAFMLDFVPKPVSGFHRFLADDLSAINISHNDLSTWLNDYLDIGENQRLEACKNMVCSMCREILELSASEPLDEDEGFFELGFDSLMITELASALKEKLQPSIKVMVTIGFDHPTINKLAKHLKSELDTHFIQKQTKITSPKQEDDSIAIIGMSCSLPNAPDIAAFEQLLEQGLSGIKEIPIERWDNKIYYDANRDAPGKSYVNKLGLIDNIKNFDAHFFGISPREAKLIEPQQRIFLECCYKALENANYYSSSLRGSLTGVFAGVGPNEYYAQLEKSGFSNEELSTYSITGNVLNLIPGRVAYTFDFKGPSISVDTACSSSLVAIHYACQGLKNRDIDYALAGGVNILLMPESNITLCKANALSADGQCKTFDEQADGYVRAEGCGVLLLKRLSDAIRDKDTILAVIKASAVNNDGKSAGLTVPNGKSQEEVMMKALSLSRLSNNDISYIEAHGTGTPLGDPIEVHAINSIYGNQRHDNNPLYIGTVKTNIGHLESAAGVAGLIKTVISLQNKKIYKHLNFKKLNPNININGTRIATTNIDWQSDAQLKSAGVNAFGFSGTNAHIILQEYKQDLEQIPTKPIQNDVLILSAKSKTALVSLANQYQKYLAATTDHFSDVCFTAATCRDHYPYRLALIANSTTKASTMLASGEFMLSNEGDSLHELPSDIDSIVADYIQGKEVDWGLHYKTAKNEYIKVSLPNYAFDKAEHWPDKKNAQKTLTAEIHPLLGQMFSLPANEYLFTQQLDLDNLSFINQHSVFGKVILPASAYIESGLSAAQLILKRKAFRLEHFNIERPLFPRPNQEYQLQIKPKGDEQYQVKIFAKQNDNWQLFSEMIMAPTPLSAPQTIDINALKNHFGERIDLSQIYEQFRSKSLFYGEEFQVLQEGYVANEGVLAKVVLSKISPHQEYFIHPALLDGAMQSMLLLSKNNAESSTYVPYTFSRMTTYQEAPNSIWIHLTKQETPNPKELCIDIKLYDNSGLLIAHIEQLRLRVVTRSNFISYEPCIHHLYQTTWSALTYNISNPSVIPEFLVIGRDENRAKKLFGQLNYQLIPQVHELVSVDQKNIVFLYQQDQFNELVHCCQTLFKARPKSFLLVTENAFAINERDKVNPYHTMANAFWKSFRNEFELNLNITIDLDEQSNLVGALRYLFSTNGAENQLAVRDSIYIPRLKKKHLPTTNIQLDSLYKSDATYLIIGGTGGIAKFLIDYLISRGVTHIALVSRSEYSTKEWIETVKEKQVQIKHYVADASHYQQMDHLIQDIENSTHPLKGVFHLAGVVHDGLIINLKEDDIQKVLSAKMDSALILHQLTKNIKLDHFVLFSSSASILGSAGQANYVAANGFLDGLAHLRRHLSLPAIAINWGPFNAIGMTKHLTKGLQQHGFIPLEKESIDILDVLLKSQLTQIAACPMHWDVYCKYVPKHIGLSELIKKITPPDQYFLNALRQQTQEERISSLDQALCDIATSVLGLDEASKVQESDSLFSLGLDSLMAIEIRNRIHDKLQCPNLNLSIEYFINDPTVEKIARYIAYELKIIFTDKQDAYPLQITSKEEVALCDFQYVFWVLNKFNSSFNLGMQFQLHGKLNKEHLAKAFDYVVQQNSAFWINFDEEVPTQVINRQGQFELIYKDVSVDNETNVLQLEYYVNIMRRIPLNKQPLIRVYLYKINNDLHELHVVIPHIIVDDISCAIVFHQFKNNYAALCQGKKVFLIPEQISYFNYVKQNNMQYEKNLNDKISFWEEYNRDFHMLRFGAASHVPNTAVQTQHLFHYPIDSQLIEQFIDWHKAKNMNVSTGLIAACQIVFLKMTRQNQIPIILIHSGREGSQYKYIVGLFSEYKRINITVKRKNRLMDCVNSIEEQLIKTAPFQKCSHLIKNRGLKGSRLSVAQYVTNIYNKSLLAKQFKKTKLNERIIDCYIEYLSKVQSILKNIAVKHKINKIFDWHIPLQKPEGMRVLLSVTPSFFTKEVDEMTIGDLNYTVPNHFGCMDRPIGNQTLWVYFSKNHIGEYQLSINGPLTTECKNLIALNFNQTISNLVKDFESTVEDLI